MDVLIDCRDCVYGCLQCCCEGMDNPSNYLLGSCTYFRRKKC